MDYVALEFEVKPQEPWSDLLADELGAVGFEMFEETEQGLKAYIQADSWDEALLEQVDTVRNPEIETLWKSERIAGKNWNEEWEKNFEPIIIGKDCVVRATFHALEGTYKYNIIIDPRMAFGTGHHATTSLMLEALLETEVRGEAVLDMGCGTGVLAILAEQKGATEILAIDIDTWAVENTIENAKANNCSEIVVNKGDSSLLDKARFNLILANINKNVILNDIGLYSKALLPGGTLFLSGFYQSDIPDILQVASAENLNLEVQREKDNWAFLRLVRA